MTEQDLELIINLILSYFKAVEYVSQKPKLSKEEKLERLLTPLIELNKLLASLHFENENPYRRWDGTYPFISERVYKDDLDLEYLDYDKSRYSIDWREDERIPDRRGPRIWKYQPEEQKRNREEAMKQEAIRRGIEIADFEDSLIIHSYPQDLYPKWLPTLDEEKIKSRDLLDQILVCYTIKRAINGDEKAVEKLYSFYEYAAEGLAVKFQDMNKNLHVKEVINTASILPRFIISGFSLEIFFKEIIIQEKAIITYPNIPGYIKDFFIYYLSDYLPPEIEEVLKESESVDKSEQRGKFIFLYFKLLALLDPYTIIRDNTRWKKSSTQKLIRKFNNYCFRTEKVKLGPHRNLTIWIFGRGFKEIDTLTRSQREDGSIGKAWKPCGKLYQLIRDTYLAELPGLRVKRRKRNRVFDFMDLDNEADLSIKDQAVVLRDNHPSVEDEMIDNEIDQETIKKVNKRLSSSGVSQRNIEIFTQWIFGQAKRLHQSELAEKFSLSTSQVKRICRKCKGILRSFPEILDPSAE